MLIIERLRTLLRKLGARSGSWRSRSAMCCCSRVEGQGSAEALGTLVRGPASVLTCWAIVERTERWLWALAGVAQWIERRPANQRVANSIPSQGTCLGGRPGPQ